MICSHLLDTLAGRLNLVGAGSRLLHECWRHDKVRAQLGFELRDELIASNFVK